MFDRLKKYSKGFTLIELLVVIAIIGILAGIVLVSFSGIQGRARDSERVSDVRQAALILQTEGLNQSVGLGGCTADNNFERLSVCNTPGDVAQFANFMDPSGSVTACTDASTVACDYGIAEKTATNTDPTTVDWQICFYLESG